MIGVLILQLSSSRGEGSSQSAVELIILDGTCRSVRLVENREPHLFTM